MTKPAHDPEIPSVDLWDVIVLGAGPAGSVAAQLMAESGARTLLADKRQFPRTKVCGACLNASAVAMLNSTGLSRKLAELGGISLNSLELRLAGRSTRLDVPGGMALSRERLDEALVNQAVAAGAHFLPHTEGLVGPIQGNGRSVALLQADRAASTSARVVLAATGLGPIRFQAAPVTHSRSAARSRIGAGCAIGEFPDCYQRGTIYMSVGKGGYVGLVQVEGRRLNVAAALDRHHVKRNGGLGAAARNILAEAGSEPVPALEAAQWRGTTALTRHTSPTAGERFFVLGDAAGYVEPFTGEGMAWALASGLAVVPLARQGIDRWDPELAQAWNRFHRRTVRRRQCLGRALAIVLRDPRLSQVAFELTCRARGAVSLLIDRINDLGALSKTR